MSRPVSEFAQSLHDTFRLVGPIVLKPMFSGVGVFREGLMFALVIADTLYLKADALTQPRFQARELPPFEYVRQGKTVSLSYYQAPEEVLEDPHEAALWARLAFDAALRSEAAKVKRKG